MNKTRLLILGMAAVIFFTSLPSAAWAIPAFARKYGTMCTMCHSTFPRLNDFGIRFRDNGYQIPGQESVMMGDTENFPPISLRTSVGYNNDSFESSAFGSDVNQFQVNGLDILAGGLIGEDIGFFLVYPPDIPGSQGVAAQNGTLETANVMFSNIGSQWFNVRVGRFEPAYTAFSVKRQLSIAPYEIYDFTFPDGLMFSDTQTGIEVSGHDDGAFRYAAGWTNGSGTNNFDDMPKDIYGRMAYTFGPGEGETAGQRIGVVGYFGKASPSSSLPPSKQENIIRYGFDASLNTQQLNLALQYLKANDNGALWGIEDDANYSGGFAELTWTPSTEWAGFTRYDWVSVPGGVGDDITRLTIGVRYYILHSLAWHTEYSKRTQDIALGGINGGETFFTTRLDFGF